MRAASNPFSATRVEALPYRGIGVEALYDLLCEHNFRGAVTGHHGSGKTTLLGEFAEFLEGRGWRVTKLRFHTDCHPGSDWWRRLGKLGGKDFLVIDGAEQISALNWIRLRFRLRRLGGLLISTHRSGRLPTLYKCQTSARLLADLVESLGVTLGEAAARDLYIRHSGNLRACLHELYDGASHHHCGVASTL